jgi:hypothetical protein
MLLHAAACEAATTSPLSSFLVPWGDRPEQLGLITGKEVENVGPLTFALSPQGELYVADTVHRQIKRWQPDGSFDGVVMEQVRPTAMRFDSRGLLLLLIGHRVEICSSTGQHIGDLLVPENVPLVEGYGQDVWAENGLICVNDPDENVYCFDPEKDLAPTTAPLILAGRPAGEGKRILVCRNAQGIQARRLMAAKARMLAQEAAIRGAGEIVMSAHVAQRYSGAHMGAVLFRGFLKRDDAFVFETEEIVGRDVHLVMKALRNGKITSSLDLPNRYFTTVYKKIALAPDESVWQMLPSADGVKFLRWEVGQ